MTIPARSLRETGVEVSEVGFEARNAITDDADAPALLREAFDLGITFFSTSGTDGEALLREALSGVRDRVTIATTFGGDGDWSREGAMRSLERSLANLGTDSIDAWQLQDPRMDAMRDDALWELLHELRSQGVVKAFGPSIGSTADSEAAGRFALEHRDVDFLQHACSMVEQQPGRALTAAAGEHEVPLLVRAPHADGLLEDRPVAGARFDADELRKVEALHFLLEDREGATMGQLALKWALSDPQNASVLPSIATREQLREFAAAPGIEALDADELGEIETLYDLGFGVGMGEHLIPS